MKYRKRPIDVEAFRVGYDWPPSWFTWKITQSPTATLEAKFETLEGIVTAGHGDWIIKGIEGELYPCKDSVFRKTYYKPKRSKTDEKEASAEEEDEANQEEASS